MPITFSCDCGRTLRVQDQFAGKKVKCPGCGGVATAPLAAAPAFEVVEDEPPAKTPLVRPTAKPAAKPAEEDDFEVVEDEKPRKKPYKARADRDEEEDEEEKPRKKKRRDYDEDEEDDRPRKKKKKKRKAAAPSGNSSNRIGYIIGGLIGIGLGILIAFLAYNSDSRRSTSRMVGGIAMAVFGGVSVVRGATGAVPDDDESDDD